MVRFYTVLVLARQRSGRLPEGFVRSPGTRPGGYLPNFFDFQPALNFGYACQKADEPWRQSVAAEGPRANRAALRTIMDHWLRLGVSGFRVDMSEWGDPALAVPAGFHADTCRSMRTRNAPPSPGSAAIRTRSCTPSGT